MSSLQSHLLSIAALFILLHTITSVNATIPIIKTNNFISKSCNATANPQLCYKSLSSVGSLVKNDPARVAQQAVSISLSMARRAQHHMLHASHQLNNTKGTDANVLNAMTFCVSKHIDAVGQINGTNRIVLTVNKVSEDEIDLSFDDMDMNVALAGSYMGECLEQWKKIPNGPVKTDVCRRTENVSRFVGIVRDLLNNLKDKMTSHRKSPPAGCKLCICCPGKFLPGGCCECCDPPPLPSMQISPEENAEMMCEPNDESCKKWARESV